MANLVPYINFVDKSHAALALYESVFGGEPEIQKDGDRVSHFEFHSGDIHFMGADHPGNQPGVTPATRYSLVLNCDSEEQLRDFYAKLRANGEETLGPSDSGWGAVIAQCTGQFGVSWLLNYDRPVE